MSSLIYHDFEYIRKERNAKMRETLLIGAAVLAVVGFIISLDPVGGSFFLCFALLGAFPALGIPLGYTLVLSDKEASEFEKWTKEYPEVKEFVRNINKNGRSVVGFDYWMVWEWVKYNANDRINNL